MASKRAERSPLPKRTPEKRTVEDAPSVDRTYLEQYAEADMPAIAPSPTAVATWRTFLDRMSPAANTPSTLVRIASSVTI